jgi:putative transposase
MKLLNPVVARVLKCLHYPLDVMLMCVRWYVAYGLSVRNLGEVMAERGIQVDHSTMHRWAVKLLPTLEKVFRHHKRPVGRSCRVDETYIKVRATGSICIAPLTRPATRSIFCCAPTETRLRPGGNLKNRSTRTANPRRSRSIRAGRIWPRSRPSTPRDTPIKIRHNGFVALRPPE